MKLVSPFETETFSKWLIWKTLTGGRLVIVIVTCDIICIMCYIMTLINSRDTGSSRFADMGLGWEW